jgi:FemAB-related protein (PEP-CTERM system-associated)
MTVVPSSVNVMRLPPEAIEGWQVSADAQADLAHAPQWADVIHRVYGHHPLYLGAEDATGRRALLPAFIVRRPFVGDVVTSMPFLDGGGPTAASAELIEPLITRLVEEAAQSGARTIELRSPRRLGLTSPPQEHKVNLVLTLAPDADVVWRALDRGARSEIRKAERSGLSVVCGGIEQVDGFYAVFASRMRELGSPVHAKSFFTTMVEAFRDRARVMIVRKDDTIIGGLVALATGDVLTVPWASCLTEYRSLCPNMLLYWETIRAACRDGFRRFDFGRSTRGSGTYRFKRQWGAEEEPLFWYTIPVAADLPATHARARSFEVGKETFIHLWRSLPLGVTRQLGPRVRKYLIQ